MTGSPADFMNLPTHWSMIERAGEAGSSEWAHLLQYYLPAIRAYLMGCTEDVNLTDELVQKFSLQFLRGGFKNASPLKGAFRHYLKRSLSNLVRQEGAKADRFVSLPDDLPARREEEFIPGEQKFFEELIRTYLSRTWQHLEQEQVSSTTPYFHVLKWVVEHPQSSSEEMAKGLSDSLGQPFTSERFRKILSRARHKFASHLYEQVAATMQEPTPDAVAQELAEMGLLSHCALIVNQRRTEAALKDGVIHD